MARTRAYEWLTDGHTPQSAAVIVLVAVVVVVVKGNNNNFLISLSSSLFSLFLGSRRSGSL